ncbi:MAG: hypothetical protein ACD_70C00128G0001 [uncultured bacterium]|nr:MAG: hypothetical protein ACD_70C00128G0001 [uncultured bacterium]
MILSSAGSSVDKDPFASGDPTSLTVDNPHSKFFKELHKFR